MYRRERPLFLCLGPKSRSGSGKIVGRDYVPYPEWFKGEMDCSTLLVVNRKRLVLSFPWTVFRNHSSLSLCLFQSPSRGEGDSVEPLLQARHTCGSGDEFVLKRPDKTRCVFC